MPPLPATQPERGYIKQVEEVTPEFALYWLAHSRQKEPKSRTMVRNYRGCMERGTWVSGLGDHIRIAWTPRGEWIMIDGHTRMQAVVEYGHPVLFEFGYGYHETDYGLLDQGLGRTEQHILRYQNDDSSKQGKAGCAIVKQLVNLANGKQLTMHGMNQRLSAAGQTRLMTVEMVLRIQPMLDPYWRTTRGALGSGYSSPFNVSASPTLMSTLFTIAGSIDRDAANEAFDQLMSNDSDRSGSQCPMRLFRGWLLNQPIRAAGSGNRKEIAATTLNYALNCFREGKQLKLMKKPQGEDKLSASALLWGVSLQEAARSIING